MKKAGVYTWITIIGGFIAVAGMIVAFFMPSIRMRGLVISFIGIAVSVVGGYMWGNNASSKSATENINAVPLSTGNQNVGGPVDVSFIHQDVSVSVLLYISRA